MPLKIVFAFLVFLIWLFPLRAQEIKPDSQPQLQMLTRSQKADSIANKKDSTQKITQDSAKIITPDIRSILSADSLPFEIVPHCAVDSITMLMRHSGKKIDTLGTFSSPPYRAVWNCKNIPDQDQIHLQPGYVLFHKSGLKIISPPLAHRWVLDRNKKISKKKYHSYQKDAPDSASIDGLIDDWRTTHATKIGNIGFFKIFWSGSHIFLAARIFDSSITYKDFVEIHFDLYNNKNEFAGINHRSISFGPKLRSNCFTVNLTDSGFTLVDSINVLISREMRWSKKTYPDGYSIEVSLPIFVLSDLQYPQKMIGFDISVIDVDDNSDKETFTSWSGTEITNRYNPSQWGNLILEQAMYPLRLMVLIGLTLFSILIAAVIVIQLVQYYKNRKIDLKDQQGYSESMNNILQHIQQSMSDPELSAATVASELCSTPEEINSIIQKETDCTFEQFVNYHKIKTARMLLRETEYTLERIAEITGLRSLDKFNKFFTESTRVTPEKYRQRKLEESEDNDNENG